MKDKKFTTREIDAILAYRKVGLAYRKIAKIMDDDVSYETIRTIEKKYGDKNNLKVGEKNN